jgi:hypothetical protein
MFRRSLIVSAAIVLVGLLAIPPDAFARSGGRGGGGGGGGARVMGGGGGGGKFIGSGGNRGGFIGAPRIGGSPSSGMMRFGAPSGRVGPNIVRSGRGVGPNVVRSGRVIGPAGKFVHVGRRSHHRVIRRAAIGFPFFAGYPYAYSSYYDGCIRPRQVLTPWGLEVRLVDVCTYGDGYYPYY